MEKTLAIIKPDAVKNGFIGPIIKRITDAGFKIVGMKLFRFTENSASLFYEVHKGKPFYQGLVEFMSSGTSVPMVLEKENAVEDYRTLIGATDPEKASEGTIRKLYAESMSRNAVHGSDSAENAIKEIHHFFSRDELIGNE